MTSLLEQVSHPRLSAKRLQVLSAHDDTAIRAAVAANPATPPGALLSLLGEFPNEVLANPSMLLHQLSDPGIFARAEPELQESWTRHRDTPSWLLAQLSDTTSEWVRNAIARHPNTPVEVVERLAFPHDFGDHESEPCAEALHHPALPPGLRFDIALDFASSVDSEFEDPAPEDMLALLLTTPEREYPLDDAPSLDSVWSTALSVDGEGLVTDEDGWSSLLWRSPEGVYTQAWTADAACHGLTGQDDEDGERDEPGSFFAGDDEATIWGMSADEVACHPDAPWWLVRRTWSRSDDALQDSLGRDSVPVTELTWQAGSRSPRVRLAVAAHRGCPAAVLDTLARDPEPMVRLAVARHPHAPDGALTALASDESASIRRAVAGNPATPSDARQTLASDRWASVRRATRGPDEDDEGDEGDEDDWC